MENASKALLIAGAILLAILLISLGIMIFNQGQDVIKNSGMSKAEISTFNSQFTKYEGDIRGTDLKALIQDVNVSNANDGANGNSRQIQFDALDTVIPFKSDSVNGVTVYKYSTSKVSSTTKYNVSIKAYDSSGFISLIEVK